MNRYILVPALKTYKNELIPVWDNRLSFENTEMYGGVINISGDSTQYSGLTDCVYDIETREISAGIPVDIYPEKTEFNVGEYVMNESKGRIVTPATVSEIVYEEFEMRICSGREIEDYLLKLFGNVAIDNNALYCLKHWKPYYILNNGKKVKWEHELFHINKQ